MSICLSVWVKLVFIPSLKVLHILLRHPGSILPSLSSSDINSSFLSFYLYLYIFISYFSVCFFCCNFCLFFFKLNPRLYQVLIKSITVFIKGIKKLLLNLISYALILQLYIYIYMITYFQFSSVNPFFIGITPSKTLIRKVPSINIYFAFIDATHLKFTITQAEQLLKWNHFWNIIFYPIMTIWSHGLVVSKEKTKRLISASVP